MKQMRLCLFVLSSFLFLFSGVLSCASGLAPLAILPLLAPVKKGQTQQFNASKGGTINKGDVVWTVIGGNANGAIDSNGLYTAPPTLPLNNLVTIQAALGPETATAQVNLQTGDTLVFPNQPTMINSINTDRTEGDLVFNGGLDDKLAVGSNGNLQIDTSWSNTPDVDAIFNQSINLGAFGNDRNLSSGIADPVVVLALEIFGAQNPGLLISLNNQVQFMAGSNQGASFGAPVILHPLNPPTNFQFQGSLAVDDQNTLHVIYFEGPDSGVGFFPINGGLFHTQSTNGGSAWSAAPVLINASPGVMREPHLAVDPQGNLLACFSVDSDGLLVGSLFDLFFAKSTNGGASWSVVNLTNSPATDEIFCRIAVDSNGTIALSFTGGDNNTGDVDIYFSKSSDGGNTFSAPQIVNSSTAGGQQFALMGIDDLGRIDIIWGSDSNGDLSPDTLMYSRSLDGGSTFSNNLTIGGGPPATFVTGMGLRHDPAGRLHIQFASDTLNPGIFGSNDLYYLRAE